MIPIERMQQVDLLGRLFSARRYSEVISLAKSVTQDFPEHDYAWKVLGAAYFKAGQSADAIAPMQRAAALTPNDVEVHMNLAIVFGILGHLDQAEISYKRALELNPDFSAAYDALGGVFKASNRLEEAETSYRRALKIKPDCAEVHCHLAILLHQMGRVHEARDSYILALHYNALFPDALNNFAALLIEYSDATAALSCIMQSLKIDETSIAKALFVSCVKRLPLISDDEEVSNVFARALTEPWCAPFEITRMGCRLLKLNPDIGAGIENANKVWPSRVPLRELTDSLGFVALANDVLTDTLLKSAPICDIELERYLTVIRSAMLDVAIETADQMSDENARNSILELCGGLAHQCFINEYVFSVTDEEWRNALNLRGLLIDALAANSQVPAIWPMVIAAYFPLHSLPLAPRLLDREWPATVKTILIQQIAEPEQETKLRAAMPCLTDICDDVSKIVQDQYEENPYPRWIKAPPVMKTASFIGYLQSRFPFASIAQYAERSSIDILIAGCGTGQHSIGVAQLFPMAKILAIDLSLASLGYAKRKTQELGLHSIEYAKADLLMLNALGRDFDVVESAGVLHHLADPWAGWRALLSVLRPGGFMRLGFYSETARKNVTRIRTYIAENGYGSSIDEIRRCRQDLIDLDKHEEFGSPLKSTDFFSASACRDLLFHVQEHCMTLIAIADFLKENKLMFLGFDIDNNALQAYKKQFPDDHAGTNLEQWHIFENTNSGTFAGMYQFWIQKLD